MVAPTRQGLTSPKASQDPVYSMWFSHQHLNPKLCLCGYTSRMPDFCSKKRLAGRNINSYFPRGEPQGPGWEKAAKIRRTANAQERQAPAQPTQAKETVGRVRPLPASPPRRTCHDSSDIWMSHESFVPKELQKQMDEANFEARL